MVNPVPGYSVSTAFRATSANQWKSCGFHTGQDYACPQGTPIVAARAGTVVHTTAGSSFGPNQFAIRCSDGTADFYAHTLDRPPNGASVAVGQTIARAGALGNTTGPHLHFERWARAGTGWPACDGFQDPMLSHNAGNSAGPSPWASGAVYVDKLRYGQRDSDSVRRLQYRLNGIPLQGGKTLPITGNYLDQTDKEVRLWQSSIGNTVDPAGASNLGPKQARRMFPTPPYTVADHS